MKDSYQVYVAKREMGKPTKAYFLKEDAEKDITVNGGIIEEMEVFEEFKEEEEDNISIIASGYRNTDLSDTCLTFNVKKNTPHFKPVNHIEYRKDYMGGESIHLNYFVEHVSSLNNYDISVIREKTISDLDNLFKEVDRYTELGINATEINQLLKKYCGTESKIKRWEV